MNAHYWLPLPLALSLPLWLPLPLPPDCWRHCKCLPLYPPTQKPSPYIPRHSWEKWTINLSSDEYSWNVKKKNCNVSKILTLQLRAAFHPGPETDRSKIGQINNWRTLWGCRFQFWQWTIKRGNTWCCHPSAPALSWICCLKLFKMAPWPCSTYNEDSKCKTSWWRTMCVHLLYFSSQGTHLSFVIRFIVQDLCPPLKHSQNLYLFHRIYIIYI